MIPSRFKANCHFCKRELNASENGVYQYVSGWSKNRSGGGTNQISLPKRELHWAHGVCIDRMTKGTFTQGGLFDAAPPPPKEPAPSNAGFDGDLLVHVCNVCGGTAPYGIGVAMRNDELGLWYCGRHLPKPDISRPAYLEP